MVHLSSKNVIHRDLAARNILLSIKGGTIVPKITDFGMSKTELNYYRVDFKTASIPIKWTGPEIFMFAKYFPASDVYAFGVLCMEILSNGRVPLPFMSAEEVLFFWKKPESEGRVLFEKPNDCPDDFYDDLVAKCFIYDYKSRPSFEYLLERCQEIQKRIMFSFN